MGIRNRDLQPPSDSADLRPVVIIIDLTLFPLSRGEWAEIRKLDGPTLAQIRPSVPTVCGFSFGGQVNDVKWYLLLSLEGPAPFAQTFLQ